jgi:hypothetical protein
MGERDGHERTDNSDVVADSDTPVADGGFAMALRPVK